MFGLIDEWIIFIFASLLNLAGYIVLDEKSEENPASQIHS